MSATEQRPLKVLNEGHRAQVAGFNQACRDLQRLGIRLHCIDLVGNRLAINHEGGRFLLEKHLVLGMTRRASAGSAFYAAQFQGVTLEWREPISYARPSEWAHITKH